MEREDKPNLIPLLMVMADPDKPGEIRIMYNEEGNVDSPAGGNVLGDVFSEIYKKYPSFAKSCKQAISQGENGKAKSSAPVKTKYLS